MKQKLTKAAQVLGTIFRNWWKLSVIIVLLVLAAYGVIATVGLTGVSIYTEKVQIVAPGGAHK